MKSIKNITTVILVIVILLIMVIIRNSNTNLFKQDVKTALDGIQTKNNLVSPDQLKKKKEPWLVVNLGNEDLPDILHFENSIHIPFENLLDQTNRNILKDTKGDLILYSEDNSETAKAWVILNQLGFKNVFILKNEENTEELKFMFEPDSSARLEHDSI